MISASPLLKLITRLVPAERRWRGSIGSLSVFKGCALSYAREESKGKGWPDAAVARRGTAASGAVAATTYAATDGAT
jgi:hypothetical protein